VNNDQNEINRGIAITLPWASFGARSKKRIDATVHVFFFHGRLLARSCVFRAAVSSDHHASVGLSASGAKRIDACACVFFLPGGFSREVVCAEPEFQVVIALPWRRESLLRWPS